MSSVYNDYGDIAIKKLVDQFNPDYLKRDLEYCDRDEEMIRAYRAAVLDRLREIMKLSFVWEVEFKKNYYSYTGPKIEFQVTARNIPMIPNGGQHSIYGDGQRFVGNDRKPDALEYAKTLADKYQCPILVGDTVKLSKKERDDLNPYILRPRVINNYSGTRQVGVSVE